LCRFQGSSLCLVAAIGHAVIPTKIKGDFPR